MAKNVKTTTEIETPSTSESNGKASKKTSCPVSRDQFRKGAKPQAVTVGGVPQIAGVKEFSTGSLGWYLNGKTVIEIDGVPVSVQVGLNLTIIGSKELPA